MRQINNAQEARGVEGGKDKRTIRKKEGWNGTQQEVNLMCISIWGGISSVGDIIVLQTPQRTCPV